MNWKNLQGGTVSKVLRGAPLSTKSVPAQQEIVLGRFLIGSICEVNLRGTSESGEISFAYSLLSSHSFPLLPQGGEVDTP